MIPIQTGDLLVQIQDDHLYSKGAVIYVRECLGHLFGEDKGVYYDVVFYPWKKKQVLAVDSLNFETYQHHKKK